MPRDPVLIADRIAGGPPGVPEPVVRDFSLTLEPGEWVSITGPNGAGKSTVALLLAGLWPLASGRLEGAHESGGARSGDVAVILQDPATQITQRTVRDELEFAGLNLGRDPEGVTAAADAWAMRLGLAADLDRDPSKLSAGRQQLALIGAALVASPRVLIADEATAHLDPSTRDLVLETLQSEVKRGLSVVWVSQIPAELSRSDRVILVASPDSIPGEAIASHGPAGSPGVPWPAGHDDAGIQWVAPAGLTPALVAHVAATSASTGARIRVASGIDIEVGTTGLHLALGPNGCGKTSLLECLAGLETLDQVTLERHVAFPHPALLASQFPERQIFEERVADELTYAAVRRGDEPSCALEKALGLLAALGLGRGFPDRRTWDLSSGERRLVQIVGVLTAPAGLLVLDEPTCGIDPVRRMALARLMGLRARESAVVVGTQDRSWLGLAAEWSRPGSPGMDTETGD